MKRPDFRAWDGKEMGQVATLSLGGLVTIVGKASQGAFIAKALMEYIGLNDSNNKPIYEGDIRREEIPEADGDRRYYYVCTWIKEWSMFAWLSITDGEYDKYISEGAEALDTTMYWTYPAGSDNDQSRITVCGNIYQNADLLEKTKYNNRYPKGV